MFYPENLENLKETLDLLLDDMASQDGDAFARRVRKLYDTQHVDLYRLALLKTTDKKEIIPSSHSVAHINMLVERGKYWEEKNKKLITETLQVISLFIDTPDLEDSAKSKVSQWLADLLLNEDDELQKISKKWIPLLGPRLKELSPVVAAIIERMQEEGIDYEQTGSYVGTLVSLKPALTDEEKKPIRDYLRTRITEFDSPEKSVWDVFDEQIVLVKEFPDLLDRDTSSVLASKYQGALDDESPGDILQALKEVQKQGGEIDTESLLTAMAERLKSKSDLRGDDLYSEIKWFFMGIHLFFEDLEQSQQSKLTEDFRTFSQGVNFNSFRVPWNECFSKLSRRIKEKFVSTYVLSTPRSTKKDLDRVNKVLQALVKKLRNLNFYEAISEMAARIKRGISAYGVSGYCAIMVTLKSGTKAEIQNIADLVEWLLSPSAKLTFLKPTLKFLPKYFGKSIPQKIQKRLQVALIEAFSRQTKKTKAVGKMIDDLLTKYHLVKGKTPEIKRYRKRIGLS